MIGRMQIRPWRQCNQVSPAVTATQTGPGTHNGMALTVKVLTGASITVSGPRYDSHLNLGASGSANANAPASVTLTPQGTGSMVYGAVNRNNSATAWTPATGCVYGQNIADSTNGAAYGTFRAGSATAPTMTASYPVYDTNTDAASLVTGSFTPAAGDILVVKVASSTAQLSWPSAAPSGGGLTFTPQVSFLPPDLAWSGVGIWTSTPVGSSPSPMTVTVPFAGSTRPHGMVVERWAGAVIAATPVTCAARFGTGNPTATLTTQVLSAVTWCNDDWNGTPGTSRAYNTTSATPSEDGYNLNAIYDTAYFAYQAASGAGVQTIGLTAPVGQTWSIIGMEILAAGSGTTTTAGVPVTAGASNGDGASGADGGVATAEIMAGTSLAEDPSAPAPVSTTAATAVTTARFTPPMGSLLVAMAATAGTDVTVTVTDDNGELDWYELASWHSGTSGYAGVWAAVVVCG